MAVEYDSKIIARNSPEAVCDAVDSYLAFTTSRGWEVKEVRYSSHYTQQCSIYSVFILVSRERQV